jgi:AhpD family alkylhydroperoxidase
MSRDLAPKRKALSPEVDAAFTAFSKAAFAPGALPAKTKQIIAVAVAHVTQCPYCIKGHTKAALRAGATPQELMEAVWVASEMRAGAAYAHSALMFAAMGEEEARGVQQSQRIAGERGREQIRHLDDLLDEALKQTFPASDPVSVGHVTSTE